MVVVVVATQQCRGGRAVRVDGTGWFDRLEVLVEPRDLLVVFGEV